MNKKLLLTLFILSIVIIYTDAKKSFKSRTSGSARGGGRKTNYNPHPAPTSFSYPQPSAPKPAPKPTLFGWQEKPSKTAQSLPAQNSKPSGQSHSYPSSQTGLSGNTQPKVPPTYQESVQRSSATQNLNGQQTAARPVQQQTNNQPSHAYPASTGLSGNAGHSYPQSSNVGNTHQQGSSYPQQSGGGLSGNGAAPPPYPGYNKPGDVNRPHNGAPYQGNNYGNNNYQHAQGPPPPYSNNNYGGYGGNSYNPGYGHQMPGYGHQMPGYGQQMPGYFGNYANYGNRGFGGVSRGSSALTGVGIAGAGVGTLLTGLALWNLARSTGRQHHTVIYDNRGQPVAVAPANSTEPVVDPFLADLVNCTLTISNSNSTDVLAIPCAIATSFSPEADVKELENKNNPNDDTKCTVTVLNKNGKEFMTTIPCSILLNSAAENNVTEPPPIIEDAPGNVNGTTIGNATQEIHMNPQEPSALGLTGDKIVENNNFTNLNCTPQPGEARDPINPCYAITHNITVAPLPTSEKNENIMNN